MQYDGDYYYFVGVTGAFFWRRKFNYLGRLFTILKYVSSWLHNNCRVERKFWLIDSVKYTSLVAVVIPTDHPIIV